jgi:DNA-binding MarR family transcriptional regulator
LTSNIYAGILKGMPSGEESATTDPANWRWPESAEDFDADVPLQALLVSATKLLGVYAEQTVHAAGLNVSLAGLGVLRVLMAGDGLKSTEVAERAWSSPGTLTAVVNTLVKNGFVERKPDDSDRRVVRLYITDSGRAVVTYYIAQAAETAVRRFFVQFIGHLGQLTREAGSPRRKSGT